VNQNVRRFRTGLEACVAVAALILLLLPAEKTLGAVIKIVYLHGALSQAGMAGFIAGGVAGVIYLLRSRASSAAVAWFYWSDALTLSGWGFWVAHFIVSMPATRLTWGPWIAWGEPRVTMTLQIVAAGLAVLAVGWLLGSARFTAGANALLGLAVIFMVERTGVLSHPFDPIGSSPSVEFRLAYLVLLLSVIAAMVLTAWRLTATSLIQGGQLADEPSPNGTEV
jgi:hypothetical protein